MADIPLISTGPPVTNAPAGAANTINPLVVAVNLLNDSTIPALSTTVTAQGTSIGSLSSSVASLNGTVATVQINQTADEANIAALQTAVTGLGGTPIKTSALPLSGTLTGLEVVGISQSVASVLTSVRTNLSHALALDYCDPRDFGSVGVWDQTGVTGISAVFQAAMAQAISANRPFRIPPGLYVVDTPIDLGVNASDGATIVGMSSPYCNGSTSFAFQNRGADVIFYSTAVNAPCFYNSQKLRGLSMSNIQVLGTNIALSSFFPNDFPQNYNLNQAYRATQFSPHCGIAIDAFNVASAPADGGYPTLGSKYNAGGSGNLNGSSGLYFDNVSILGFVVGAAFCPSGNSNQTDTILFNRCNINNCDTAIATGSGQAKDAYFMYGNLGGCRQGFDGVNYGGGQGFPFIVMGTNFAYLHRIVNYQDGFGPMILMPSYTESVRSIGNYGSGSSTARGHCSISLGQFTIDNSDSLPPVCTFESYGLAVIRDTNFQSAGSPVTPVSAWNFGNDLPSPIKLDSCTFSGSGAPTAPSVIGIQGTSIQGCVVELDNCLMGNTTSPAMPISDGSAADVSAFTLNNRFMGSVRSGRYSNGTSVVEYIPPNTTSCVALAVSAVTSVTRSVTFASIASGAVGGTLTSGNWGDRTGWYLTTFPNADVRPARYTNGSTAVSWGSWNSSSAMTTPTCTAANVGLTFTATDATIPMVGDMILWFQLKQYSTSTHRAYPSWIITSNVSGAITCQPMFDATTFDTVANNGGNLQLVQRNWAPSGSALTCTTDGTTAVITAVSPITVLVNGDWVTGTGLPANCRVLSGGGTATVTLNKNTTAANAGTALHLGTLQQPTLTTVW